MLERLHELEREGLQDLAQATDDEGLQAWKVKYLGRSAELGRILDGLRTVSKEERPALGKRANEVKQAFEAALEDRQQKQASARLTQALHTERLDMTLPGRRLACGRRHPATQTLRQIVAIWAEMGFQVYRSREVETEAYNFELLNIPAHHPARDMWDTFYTTTPGVVLRTHTSPGQIHVMRARAPEPIRVVLPGMCYRYEQVSARSEIQFNQVEPVACRNITFETGRHADAFADGCSASSQTPFRARTFRSPTSAEMDIECFVCSGSCPCAKTNGWSPGQGMVHPTVLANGGYDPEEFSGFAFGMGPERITMLRHRIEDIRSFWANDLRFLEQF
jgi:phenylalanyl-tRNA synthetase alpha chain